MSAVDERQNIINEKHNTKTNLSQVLTSYFLCMQGPLCALTLCHARHVRESILGVTKTY
jgi:hypothetical protein